MPLKDSRGYPLPRCLRLGLLWLLHRFEQFIAVGPSERLLRQGLVATDMNWFREPDVGEAIHARIRHRGGLLSAEIEGHDPCKVRFDAPAHAIAAGQGVVLYAGDEVLGGGWIREAFA